MPSPPPRRSVGVTERSIMFKTVIWATDGSETAAEALPYALAFGKNDAAKLVVVHARAAVAREVGADLIVVGTHGYGRVAGLLLGSVTQGLLHSGVCPVLAIP